jgi:hypothetical protein
MIHGDCASVGCYAMTDEQITEIYSLAREAFFGGQRSLQIQAYPFRMTPLNMAKHRNSTHLDFWKALKEGYDHFEVTRKEPKVAVCDKHYVFDAQSSGKFNPVDPCPAFKVPQPIASAVHNKQHRDEIETTQLIGRGIPAALATNSGEGGMNPVFVSALRSNGGPGTAIRTASGTIPARVHPPSDALPQGTIASIFGIGSPEMKSTEVRVASTTSHPALTRPPLTDLGNVLLSPVISLRNESYRFTHRNLAIADSGTRARPQSDTPGRDHLRDVR